MGSWGRVGVRYAHLLTFVFSYWGKINSLAYNCISTICQVNLEIMFRFVYSYQTDSQSKKKDIWGENQFTYLHGVYHNPKWKDYILGDTVWYNYVSGQRGSHSKCCPQLTDLFFHSTIEVDVFHKHDSVVHVRELGCLLILLLLKLNWGFPCYDLIWWDWNSGRDST